MRKTLKGLLKISMKKKSSEESSAANLCCKVMSSYSKININNLVSKYVLLGDITDLKTCILGSVAVNVY